MSDIILQGVREGNLKNISLTLPRGKLIVFTGLSGSGKSTLAMDVIFQECQRQYLEAMGMQGLRKPKVDSIQNLSPALLITQSEANRNPRSTVGTLTDIYTELRMIFEKLGLRECPHCHTMISAADCKEELEKKDGEFTVYMYCCHCKTRMQKLTRSHFSYNTREGACPVCQGLGKTMTINEKQVLHEELSLEDGAVDYWDANYRDYQIGVLYNAFRYYSLPSAQGVPVNEYSSIQRTLLLYGVESEEFKLNFPELAPPKTVAAGRFEGIYTTLRRRLSEKGRDAKKDNPYFHYARCPECNGEKLNALSRKTTVEGIRLPELSLLSLEELLAWLKELEKKIGIKNMSLVESYLLDLSTKLERILCVGLGYLSLDRQTITLSGGELQRLKLAAALASELTGIIYIMDEPTIGLHPKDTDGMIRILKKLRDRDNTVIVIEHDTEVMKAADYIVDIGPGSGKHGGEIIGSGTLTQLMEQETSVTGNYLKKQEVRKSNFRQGSNELIKIHHANLYNLKNVDVSIPCGCLTTVTGVSGSGKSTLIFEVLAKAAGGGAIEVITEDEREIEPSSIMDDMEMEGREEEGSDVIGLENFDQVITISQAAITRMKRSNVATYSEVYTEIRTIFGSLPQAKQQGLTAKHFSFNTKGGRCENCEGLGTVSSNMLFFADIDVICPVCQGKQFKDEVLAVTYRGCNIKDILKLNAEEALEVFSDFERVTRILSLLVEVGLGYLELGQAITTLSGGEAQRLKLAKELLANNNGKKKLYLMDEPTTGLHPIDVENFLALLNRMVEAGNTVIVVEHNQQIIKASDWIVDLGPGGGDKGGRIVFEGTPEHMLLDGRTATAEYLRIS